ncbi:hypothetical protein [Viridibacillus soli]|uniref:hypothetical protein n=1 Tax=Viridibacillus soli TaxID=2798301 RepID=UPI001F466811|nr:hypothetical protein [Viridibacillus soli]
MYVKERETEREGEKRVMSKRKLKGWSYADDPALTHFEKEVYDQNLRNRVKADERDGIVEKQPKKRSNYQLKKEQHLIIRLLLFPNS